MHYSGAQSGVAQTILVEFGFGSVLDLHALRTTTDLRCTLSEAYGGIGIALHCTALGQDSTAIKLSVRQTMCTVVNGWVRVRPTLGDMSM